MAKLTRAPLCREYRIVVEGLDGFGYAASSPVATQENAVPNRSVRKSKPYPNLSVMSSFSESVSPGWTSIMLKLNTAS